MKHLIFLLALAATTLVWAQDTTLITPDTLETLKTSETIKTSAPAELSLKNNIPAAADTALQAHALCPSDVSLARQALALALRAGKYAEITAAGEALLTVMVARPLARVGAPCADAITAANAVVSFVLVP